MLQITQFNILYQNDSPEYRRKKLAGRLRLDPSDIRELRIVKKSLDARKKPEIYITYTFHFRVEHEDIVLQKNRRERNLSRVKEVPSLMSRITRSEPGGISDRPVIVGAGPAGLFCAYYLGLCGFAPVLIERGAPVEERTLDVERFWQDGILDEESNVSFGEGGAGTFSDGKLNTGVKDRDGRKQLVLETFVRFGAREDILYDAKPHIGTDILRTVIVNMRKELIRLGCEIHFHTKMKDIITEDGVVRGIVTERRTAPDKVTEERLACGQLVLAIGHSARDTFAMLERRSVHMTRKAFAVGMRVQHRQEDIDLARYGAVDHRLPVSSYKAAGKAGDGRGVYTFCMCPGGYVVNASSERGGLTVNGMSDADRDSGNANSAVVVTVQPEDFEGSGVLAGVEFQRRWETAAYELCQGKIPVQRFGDFRQKRKTLAAGKVLPCVKGKWEYAELHKILPKFVINGMIEGMEQFGRSIPGFDHEDTLLMGVETRTSSPVRIERDKEYISVSVKGLYPCGEGAGYAGGIMSAAMDGLRTAMKLEERIASRTGGHHARNTEG